jgi:tRNA(Ile)-lysidine synthase
VSVRGNHEYWAAQSTGVKIILSGEYKNNLMKRFRQKQLSEEKKFLETIRKKKLIVKGDSVLIALSGGSDSVALFHLLLSAQPFLSLSLSAGHCNFQLRGKASEHDAEFCQRLCDQFNIPFFSRQFNTRSIAKNQKTSLEETARNLRYDFFETLMQPHAFTKLATAHHRNDNAETILFNLFRGSSLLGLSGIAERRESLIRPLLGFTHEELLSYLEKKKASYCIDESNFHDEPDRNFIRLKVIPLIEERFKHKLLPSLIRLSENATELEDFIERHVGKLMRRKGLSFHGNAFDIIALQSLTQFEQKELFKRALAQFDIEPNAKRLEQLAALLTSQSGRKVTINPSLEVCWEKGILRFTRAK